MNRQQMFHAIVKFGLKQNERSMLDVMDDGCAYRGHTGLCCFVGALIPDNLYEERFEGKLPSDIIRMNEELLEYLIPSDLEREEGESFLKNMQQIHDRVMPDSWHSSFVSYANQRGLTMPPTESVNDFKF